MDNESHEEMVQIVEKAPSGEWIDAFFDRLDELLAKVEPIEDDPRLVTSITRGDRIAVTMNSRYVLTAYLEEQQTGFIVRDGGEHTDEILEDADGRYAFDALQGEHGDETPYFVTFDGDPKSVIDETVRDHWLQASAIEFDRWTGSPYVKYHEPLARKAAVDAEYRGRLLDEAVE